jgi:beta-galactosidase
MQNGLEQLREMIERDRDHPCGLLVGLLQRDRRAEPARRGVREAHVAEAKALDPTRLARTLELA